MDWMVFEWLVQTNWPTEQVFENKKTLAFAIVLELGTQDAETR